MVDYSSPMRDGLVTSTASKSIKTLKGQLLIAHPIVENEALSKTVIFVESDDGDFAEGFILNRPLNFMLKGLGAQFENLGISDTPVYDGGNDDKNFVTLTAWVANSKKHTLEIYYNLTDIEAYQLLGEHKNIQLRAYLGHCVFSRILREQILKGLWVIGSPINLFGSEQHGENLWKSLLNKEHPEAFIY